ncbi:MAG: DUF5011 domain-containing protein [Anaerorhabdus sp.]|uniref:immunoglobulin-like domain-containing protein n=1 Tax=Anaerorhabdus sp. TaxID=1872524 RepID=UPI002FCBDA1C
MKKFLLYSCLCLVLLTGCTQEKKVMDPIEKDKKEDTIPPVINVKNYVFETMQGNPINIDTATAIDAYDGPCDVRVLGTVNFNKPGEYYLEYLATDLSGNESKASFTVIVKEKIENSESTASSDNPNEEGCNGENVYDPSLSCNHMITDVNDMVEIYQDQSGYKKCMAKVEEFKENGFDYECVKLYQNDQKIWGYGLIKK